MPDWQTIMYPGYLGKRRDVMSRQWDHVYGKDRWRLVWPIGERLGGFDEAVLIYGEAYLWYLQQRIDLLDILTETARDVYDDAQSNVRSGLDFAIQETYQTHLQDIAVRRAVVHLGRHFRGNRLVQIRTTSEDEIGRLLSPAMVPFHRPDWIMQPEPVGWWTTVGVTGCVEAWWQSKQLQVWS